MSIVEICEPFFQFVCRVNRAHRRGVDLDERHVLAQLEDEMAAIHTRASSSSDSGLVRQAEELERPLLYFFDSLMVRGPFGSRWPEVSMSRGWRGYEQDFFVILDETLSDQSKEAAERLKVFHTCLGLGFEGFFEGQPEKIADYMREIQRRCRSDDLGGRFDDRLCPKAYDHTDPGEELCRPIGAQVGGVGIAVVGLILVLFAVVFVGYWSASSSLNTSLNDIITAHGGGTSEITTGGEE